MSVILVLLLVPHFLFRCLLLEHLLLLGFYVVEERSGHHDRVPFSLCGVEEESS